jgi:hypothetical protein
MMHRMKYRETARSKGTVRKTVTRHKGKVEKYKCNVETQEINRDTIFLEKCARKIQINVDRATSRGTE